MTEAEKSALQRQINKDVQVRLQPFLSLPMTDDLKAQIEQEIVAVLIAAADQGTMGGCRVDIKLDPETLTALITWTPYDPMEIN